MDPLRIERAGLSCSLPHPPQARDRLRRYYLPAIPEAIELIENWIARKGPQLEWTGMLAWAKGCVGEYAPAEAHGDELLRLAQSADPQEAMEVVLQAAEALVDCFASAQELERARRVAQTAWQHCRYLDAEPCEYRAQPYKRKDDTWLSLFHRAGLPIEEIARELLAHLGPEPEHRMEDRGVTLSIRAWTGDLQAWLPDWLAWARTCADCGAWQIIGHFRGPVGIALRTTGQLELFSQWAQATWEWLETAPGKEATTLRPQWNWERFNVWAYLKAGDLRAAEALTYRAIEELGSVRK